MPVEMTFLQTIQCLLLCTGGLILMASPYLLLRFLCFLWCEHCRFRDQQREAKRVEEEVARILDNRSKGIIDTSENRRGSKHNPVYHTELDDDDFI